MDQLTSYIIFHKKLFPENTPNLPCFIYLGANEHVKKEIDMTTLKHPVIYEYELPSYNPMYQMLMFYDNSVYLNVPPPPTPFVGFCQYDMCINEEKYSLIFKYLDNSKKMVGFYPYNVQTIQDVLRKEQWNEILDIYNVMNNTIHTLDDFNEYPFFLMNTWILPSWFYRKLQLTLHKVLPTICKFLNYNMRHMAGTLERTNALIIACALKENTLIGVMSDAIIENRSQTMFDTFRD